jgi:hypothetical protein
MGASPAPEREVAMKISNRMVLMATMSVLFSFVMAGTASAGCIYNGQEYPEGAAIGVLVCTNGQWVGG